MKMARFTVVAVDVPGHTVKQILRADGSPLGAPVVSPPTSAEAATPPTSDGTPPTASPPALPDGLPWYVPRTRPERTRPERTQATLTAAPVGMDGAAVRRRREALGLTQRDLAAAAGMQRGYLAEVERGHRNTPTPLARLAATLDRLEAERERQALEQEIAALTSGAE
jgi:DNA-binding transcriptional regulator YiaG